MNRGYTPIWARLSLTFFGALLFVSCSPRESMPSCTSAVVASIISTERPGMGAAERAFWQTAIETAAAKRDVPAPLLASLVAQESKFRGGAKSSAGAIGATQVMPLWKRADCKGYDLEEIEQNLDCGALVLAKYIAEGKGVPAGLRRYVAGPNGQAKAQWYSDQILARLMIASAAGCPTQGALLAQAVKK